MAELVRLSYITSRFAGGRNKAKVSLPSTSITGTVIARSPARLARLLKIRRVNTGAGRSSLDEGPLRDGRTAPER